MSSTMLHTCVCRTLVVAHSEQSPTDDEWGAWIARMGQLDYDCVLIATRGGAPNAKQRTQTNDFWQDKTKPKMAVLSDSPAVRGALFAFYYLFKGTMKPFPANHAGQALNFLGVSRENYAEVLTAAGELQDRLSVAKKRRSA